MEEENGHNITENSTTEPSDEITKPSAEDKTSEQPEQTEGMAGGNGSGKKEKKHWIHPTWLRRVLKTFMWIIFCVIFLVILIPILFYIPPVQTFIKNVACEYVAKSTGMKISIDQFRLKWPLDVSLKGVSVVEATGDTMVYAKEVIADVKMRPLLKLDVDIEEVKLVDAGLRIMSADSSMLLKLKANLIDIDDKSSVDIKTLTIDLNKVEINGGDLQLAMDVWKKKPTEDTTATLDMKIMLHEAVLNDFKFGMTMLPTIDTLSLASKQVVLRNGIVDLGTNKVTADYIGTSDGDVTYLTPTPEYIAAHPAPIDTTSVASPPMIISGDTIRISDFKALYATKGAKPLPGFDPSYIQVSNVNILVDGFYNEATTIKLPIMSMTASERSGLVIREGSGVIEVDSAGLAINDLRIKTLYSDLGATANVPFAVMEMKRNSEFYADAFGNIGWPDIESFMPSLSTYTKKLPARSPLTFDLRAEGTLDDIELKTLAVKIKDVMQLNASGYARNAFDFKHLQAAVDFDASITGPKTIEALLDAKDFDIPTLTLKGHATAQNETYAADFDLRTSVGELLADGQVSMNSERYDADVTIKDINVKHFMPDLGIGKVNAHLLAKGAGFNPTISNATTDIQLTISSIDYNLLTLHNITADVTLHNGEYDIILNSPNDPLWANVKCVGTIAKDRYTFDLDAAIRKVDLFALGFTEDANNGGGTILLKGSASPDLWLYDIDLCAQNLEWTSGADFFAIPNDIDLRFISTADKVTADLDASRTCLNFEAASGLKPLIDSFTVIGDTISREIAQRNLDIEKIQKLLPRFSLNLDASGRGALGDILIGAGLSMDTLSANISNDSIITARISAIELASATMRADTLSLDVKQRGELLDYLAHMGNRSDNPIGDFADVNVRGYVGENRLMLGLNQKNQKGETGYKLGLTAAFTDSIITLHFTPLKAMIGYIPWTFNSDNSIEFNIKNYRVIADLMAQSPKSSIMLKTETGREGNDELHIALDNIQVQDFLNLAVNPPPITASLNMDMNVGYYDSWFYGLGSLGIHDLTYDKMKVGNFDLSLRAGRNDDGSTGARLGLKIDGKNALAAKAMLVPDSASGFSVKTMGLELTQFPLKIANAFLGKDIASLSGYLNGDFGLTGTFKAPILNGYLACDSVGVFIPMMGSSIKFNEDSILVKNNVIDFNKFDIWGANKNPIVIDGTVDVSSLKSAVFDLRLNAQNFQLMNNDSRARSDLYGKLFMNLNASARGPMEHFSVNANVDLLSNTDVTYSIPQTTAQLTSHNTTGIVRFVNFNDTSAVHKEDSVVQSIAMRIVAALTLEPGVQAKVIYPGSTTTGSAKVEIEPSGTLNYFQNYMGDMRLNGQLYIGNGFASYSMPIVGEKKFVFNPASYVMFNGDIMNPSFNISATDDVKASVVENNASRIVNFLVEVDITNNLNNPKIEFNLNTDDDLTIRNELQSMTADQRSMAALNMLLTGQYTGQGVKTASSDLLQGTMYNILTSSINGWLANNVRGVDISLGVDQFDRTGTGEGGTSTSYSYTLSKSLFNNRFKISVGGNYTTDASADENFSENLINDISFEYILKQTANVTMYAKLFRHTGYESVLEGEITETGVGFLLRRRLSNLKNLFRWGSRKNNNMLMPGAGTGMPGMMPRQPGMKPNDAEKNLPDSVKTEKDSMKKGEANEK